MKSLLIEYIKSKKLTQQMLENTSDEYDIKILNSILRELDFIIKWLEIGKNPNENNKEISNLQCYVVDQQVLEVVISESMYVKPSDDEYEQYLNNDSVIAKALAKLSKNELESFVMVKCEGYSLNDVGQLKNVSKGTIQKELERSQKKIDRAIEEIEVMKLINDNHFKSDDILIILQSFSYDDLINIESVKGSSNVVRIIRYWLMNLRRNDREILIIKYIKEKSNDDIADTLNLTKSRIDKSLLKSLNSLRVLLKEEPIKEVNRVKREMNK